MIYLEAHNLCIITPPKTASTSLWQLLCRPPHDGVLIVGPSMYPGNVDKHCVTVPNLASSARLLVTVRHPLDRLVSLYYHYTREESYWGRWCMPWSQFAGHVFAGQPVTGTAVDPFYTWNLSRHLAENNLPCESARVESLWDSLRSLGLSVPTCPRANVSHRRPWRDYYSTELLDNAREWARPDCEAFGYEI